ncbi:hypothetical protein Dimus_004211 [Dionaea muscipula]
MSGLGYYNRFYYKLSHHHHHHHLRWTALRILINVFFIPSSNPSPHYHHHRLLLPCHFHLLNLLRFRTPPRYQGPFHQPLPDPYPPGHPAAPTHRRLGSQQPLPLELYHAPSLRSSEISIDGNGEGSSAAPTTTTDYFVKVKPVEINGRKFTAWSPSKAKISLVVLYTTMGSSRVYDRFRDGG